MASPATSSTADSTDSPKPTGRFWTISIAIGMALLAVSRMGSNDELLQVGGVLLIVIGSVAFAIGAEPAPRKTVSKDRVPSAAATSP